MDRYLNPKGFLFYGGIVLIIVGILSYLPFTNAQGSIFGSFWWFDGTEGVVHILLGVVAIAASYVLGADLQRWLVILVGIAAVVAALYGLVAPTDGPIGTGFNTAGVANLERIMDTVLHLFVAAWAFAAAFATRTAVSRMT